MRPAVHHLGRQRAGHSHTVNGAWPHLWGLPGASGGQVTTPLPRSFLKGTPPHLPPPGSRLGLCWCLWASRGPFGVPVPLSPCVCAGLPSWLCSDSAPGCPSLSELDARPSQSPSGVAVSSLCPPFPQLGRSGVPGASQLVRRGPGCSCLPGRGAVPPTPPPGAKTVLTSCMWVTQGQVPSRAGAQGSRDSGDTLFSLLTVPGQGRRPLGFWVTSRAG